jgi:hypothetical protein
VQVVTSMPNARLSRWAQVIDRRRAAGLRSSAGAEPSAGAVAGRRPREDVGVVRLHQGVRQRALGAWRA